ncbi:release factor [Vararia minispora EC-137]|uniref:Release factor n=1 Tax=Vararia minispora EC-137 TaxID=1314806 RepID=A0ACB8Q510_9AGAM|nr:release factor [Vararia minispora EC-137]
MFPSVAAQSVRKAKNEVNGNLSRLEKEHERVLRAVETGHNAYKALETEARPSGNLHLNIAASKQRKILQPLEQAWSSWLSKKNNLYDALSLYDSPELFELAQSECGESLAELTRLAVDEFPPLLIPESETAKLSALMEIKSGVGGQESSLFVGDLVRVYTRFAHANNFMPAVVTKNTAESGGLKDAVLEIQGAGAYDALRWESGVHRVQRIPLTETSGRVHTSTVAVVVLPLMEDPPSGDEDLFKMEDVKVEAMRARGAGGQHVNKTESAIRLTHIPTGITVSMQDERSQHQNRRRAFQVLRARLMDIRLVREQQQHRDARRSLVRTMDRSEKIRTYNNPQDRVTDHRLGKRSFSWDDIMEGDGLSVVCEDLKVKYNAELLEENLERSVLTA